MTKRIVTFKVTFRERDIAAVLDMLRYEASIVLGWDTLTRDTQGMTYSVTLRTEANLFQPDRWASFMLFPRDIVEGL